MVELEVDPELEKAAVSTNTPGAFNPLYSAKPVSQLNEGDYLVILPGYEQVDKVWSDEARAAALEARRRKAKPKEEPSKRRPLFTSRSKAVSLESESLVSSRFVYLVKKYTSEMSENELNTLKAISLRKRPGSEWGERVPRRCGGAFFPTRSEIFLYEEGVGVDPRSVKSFVLHEIGHAINSRMSDVDKRMWEDFWTKFKKDMPSAYARTNSKEGFAESYMKYRKKSKALKEHVGKLMAYILGEGDVDAAFWEEMLT